MKRRLLIGLITLGVLLGTTVGASADIWDPSLMIAAMDPSITSTVSVFTMPDGSGFPLSEAMIEPGLTVDATITLTLLDQLGNPVLGFPYEDMWLETSLGGLMPCPGGSVSDADTDALGVTTFSGPLHAGGFSDRAAGEVTKVSINGTELVGSDLDILFNSPDLDGDGQVGLSDTVAFVPLYTGGVYEYSVDYYFDGTINLSDLVLYAGGLNKACP